MHLSPGKTGGLQMGHPAFFYLDPAYILQYWYKTIQLCDLFELAYLYMQEVGSGERSSSPLPDIDIGGKLLPY